MIKSILRALGLIKDEPPPAPPPRSNPTFSQKPVVPNPAAPSAAAPSKPVSPATSAQTGATASAPASAPAASKPAPRPPATSASTASPPPSVAPTAPKPAASASAAGAKPKNTAKVAITVTLSKDRMSSGWLKVVRDGQSVLGPLVVIATIDAEFASRSGNPNGDRKKPFGHVPTGRYRLLGQAMKDHVPLPLDEDTGPWPILVLRAIDGEAALAEAAGRGDLLLHGGPVQPGLGTLRLSDGDMKAVLDTLRNAAEVTVEVIEQAAPTSRYPVGRRSSSPSGPFPKRSFASAGTGTTGRGYQRTDTYVETYDPMDGFLTSYLIGWPTAPTPGAWWGYMLHQQEDQNRVYEEPCRPADDRPVCTPPDYADPSADRLRDLGIPVQADEPPPPPPAQPEPVRTYERNTYERDTYDNGSNDGGSDRESSGSGSSYSGSSYERTESYRSDPEPSYTSNDGYSR